MIKDYLYLDKIFADFKYQLTEEQIASLLAGKAKIKIEPNEPKKQSIDFNINEIIAKLDGFESQVDAEEYIRSLSLNVDSLRQLSRHYSIPNNSKLKSQDMVNKIIAATVGTKERHKALYETKL